MKINYLALAHALLGAQLNLLTSNFSIGEDITTVIQTGEWHILIDLQVILKREYKNDLTRSE